MGRVSSHMAGMTKNCQLEECDLPARRAYCSREHSERARNRRRKRRSRPGFSAPYSWDETVELLRERDGDACQLCRGELGPVKFGWRRWRGEWDPLACQIDHVHPVAAGGDDEFDNLQIAHATCNISKRDAVPEVGRQPVFGPTRSDMPRQYRRGPRKGRQWKALHGPWLEDFQWGQPCKYPDKTLLTAYNYGCRCQECVEYHREYQAEYYEKRKLRSAV